jgi:hypothetical protein
MTQPNDLINTLGGPDGFGTQYLAPNDDGSSSAIDITAAFPDGINLYGTYYTSIYVNNNGNVTFSSPLSTYTPAAIGSGYTSPIIAPYWGDVDTRGGAVAPTGGNTAGTNLTWYNVDAATHTVTVTWDDVGYYSEATDKVNAFQLQLTAEPDSHGNYTGLTQIEFIYQTVEWTTGTASGGSDGLGGTPAREGFSAGDGVNYEELPGSGDQTSDLALASTIGNTGTAGVWVFNTTDTGTIECFAAGTLLASADGEVAVETLRPGDLVKTLSGALKPILWIGERQVACHRHPDPESVQPVRVAADAFGKNMPHTDLWLSPDHAIYCKGVLVPVRYLVDGKLIARVPVDAIQYFHIELAGHDIVLAQGLCVETYLDTGGRANFSNGGTVVNLHPRFAIRQREAYLCAPLEITGPRVEAIRNQLAQRARMLGKGKANAAVRIKTRGHSLAAAHIQSGGSRRVSVR